ncbi:mannitol-1-phosphate 5-dehydrogenase [Xylariaceae sp. FL0594]|nr:mannitol-1-phosphate 5-dehydrogenase [Xylariaceae sp. FL0594]
MTDGTPTLKAVQFGAGNIGRGFVGCFLKDNFQIVFADTYAPIVEQLNNQKSYNVIEFGTEKTEPQTIKNLVALHSVNEKDKLVDEISTADLVTCAVGPGILKYIAPTIAEGVLKRSADKAPVAIIACENIKGNTHMLHDEIKKHIPSESVDHAQKVAIYANCAVDRIAPAQPSGISPDVQVEKYAEWVIDRTPFKDRAPFSQDPKKDAADWAPLEIAGVKWVDDLEPYIERKLFTVNTAHATAAYFGYNRNKPNVHDAMADPNIKAAVEAAVTETAAYIVKKYPSISEEEQRKYKAEIIKRISNPALNDSVLRVGRDPMRKLGLEERFIGPAAALAKEGMEIKSLLAAIEMAFRFQNVEGDEPSETLAKLMAEKNPDEVIQEVCIVKKRVDPNDSKSEVKLYKLEPDHPLYDKIKEVVQKVQADSRD